MAIRRSSSSREPHFKTNGQIASGSSATKFPSSMTACHRESLELPALHDPGEFAPPQDCFVNCHPPLPFELERVTDILWN